MATPTLRFVHAADLHLDQPLFGISEVPPSLRDHLIDAPYVAAERIIDAAIQRGVDFVVLSGDVLNLRQGDPRAISFLLGQFERLDAERIAVYWATGGQDCLSRWPSGVTLPERVKVLPKEDVAALNHTCRSGREITILGISGGEPRRIVPSQWTAADEARTAIAIARGSAEPRWLAKSNVSYWALGGSHQRKTSGTQFAKVHYPGTPQGRCPKEHGAHGCTLVEIDDQRKVTLQQIDTDAVRWATLKVCFEKPFTSHELRQAAGDRLLRRMDEPHRPILLVSWIISAPQTLPHLRDRRVLSDGLVEWLRTEFADASPPVWTVTAESHLPDSIADSSHDEKTILGDFLNIVRQCQLDEELPLELENYLPEHTAERFAAAANLDQQGQRSKVLREAAALGIGLLRGTRTA